MKKAKKIWKKRVKTKERKGLKEDEKEMVGCGCEKENGNGERKGGGGGDAINTNRERWDNEVD